MRQRSMLDLVGREGANELSRRVSGEIENRTLDHGTPQFAMQLTKGILIMGIDASGVERTDEVGCSGGDFAAKGFKLAGLP